MNHTGLSNSVVITQVKYKVAGERAIASGIASYWKILNAGKVI